MGSVVFRLLVERRKGPWGVCVCASVTDFTDFTSIAVLLYVVLCYVALCFVTGNDRVTFCLLVESSRELLDAMETVY